jgi:hypothetical protein
MAATGLALPSSVSAQPPAGRRSPFSTPTAVGAAPAVPSTARMIGVSAATQRISATVTLKPADPAGLEAYATAVSTPGNALYRYHLDTARFAAEFGPSPSTIALVQKVLADDGLTTATFARAFGNQFKQYRLAGAPHGPRSSR